MARRRTANVATLVGASRGRDRRDARLASEVEDRLAEAFGSATGEVRVSAHRGSVTLRGEVARLDDIDAFEAHARGIAGVDDVNNLLRLPVAVARSAAPPPASTA